MFADVGRWYPVRDGDERALGLYLRHYSARRQRRGRLSPTVRGNHARFVGPGEKLVLLTPCGRAMFAWRRQLYRRDGRHGVECVIFRNEGAGLSSELIDEACELAWQRWPGETLWTFVAPRSVRSANPGYCFKVAGFSFTGANAAGLHVLERQPTRLSIVGPVTESGAATFWRSRIVGLTYEDPRALDPHPLNPKVHPPTQSAALRAVLAELGWIGTAMLNDRTRRLVDGHDRRDQAIAAGQATIPVLHVDLDEAEELVALMTFDAIGQLAQLDAEANEALLDRARGQDPVLVEFLAHQHAAGPPDEFPAYDESVADGLVLRARWIVEFPDDAAADVRAALEPLKAQVAGLKVAEA